MSRAKPLTAPLDPWFCHGSLDFREDSFFPDWFHRDSDTADGTQIATSLTMAPGSVSRAGSASHKRISFFQMSFSHLLKTTAGLGRSRSLLSCFHVQSLATPGPLGQGAVTPTRSRSRGEVSSGYQVTGKLASADRTGWIADPGATAPSSDPIRSDPTTITLAPVFLIHIIRAVRLSHRRRAKVSCRAEIF